MERPTTVMGSVVFSSPWRRQLSPTESLARTLTFSALPSFAAVRLHCVPNATRALLDNNIGQTTGQQFRSLAATLMTAALMTATKSTTISMAPRPRSRHRSQASDSVEHARLPRHYGGLRAGKKHSEGRNCRKSSLLYPSASPLVLPSALHPPGRPQ